MEIKRIVSRKFVLLVLLCMAAIVCIYLYRQQCLLGLEYVDENGETKSIDISYYTYGRCYSKIYGQYGGQEQALRAALEEREGLWNQYWNYYNMPEGESNEADADPSQKRFFELLEQDGRFAENEDWLMELYVLRDLADQTDRQLQYPSEIQNINEQAEKILEQEYRLGSKSFAIRNVKKTVKDLSGLSDIETAPCNTTAVDSVLEMRELPFLILFIMLLFLMAFMEERKKGLWELVYQTAGGRGRLAWIRYIICLAGGMVISLLVHCILYGTAFTLYGGIDCLVKPIQMVSGYEHCLYHVSIFQMIFLQGLFMGLCAGTVCGLIWGITALLNTPLLGIGCSGILLLISEGLYSFIPNQSVFAWAKYINMGAVLDVPAWLSQYHNILFFNMVISGAALTRGFLGFLVCFTAILCICIGRQMHPIMHNRMHNRLLKWAEERWACMVEGLPHTGKELYWQLWVKRTGIVLAAGVYIVAATQIAAGVEDSRANRILNQVYSTYSGPLPVEGQEDTIYTYLLTLRTELEDMEKKYLQAKELYASDEMTADQMFMYYSLRESMETEYTVYNTLMDQIERLQASDQKLWLIDERGYSLWLSERCVKREQQLALIVLALVMFLAAVLHDTENSIRINDILQIASGRTKQRRCKTKTLLLQVLFAGMVVYGVELWNIIHVYGLSDLCAPAASIAQLDMFPVWITVGEVIGALYTGKLLLLLGLAVIFERVALRLRFIQAFCLELLLFLPRLFTMLGIAGFRYLDISRLFCCIEIWLSR